MQRFPRVSAGRVTGIVLFYLNLLGWFAYAVPGFDAAKSGTAGGYLGGGIYWLLSQALGRPGAWFALAAWSLISIVFILDLSVPEIAEHIGAFFGKLPKPAPRLPPSKNQAHWAAIENRTPPRRTPYLKASTASILATPLPLTALQQACAGILTIAVNTPHRLGRPVHAVSSGSQASMVPGGDDLKIVKLPEKPWTLPSMDAVLDPAGPATVQTHYDKERAHIIEETLASFGAPSHIVEIHRGPSVTQFGVEPDFVESRGGRMRVRVSKIVNLADDLALALAAPRIRIQAPVPGRSYVGIEVPNTEISRVALRELLESEVLPQDPLQFEICPRQGCRRKTDLRRPGLDAAFAHRRHHQFGQVGLRQRHPFLSALE